MKEIIIDNNLFKIGENAQDNWNILDTVNSTDIFFHLSSFPSCYVILKCNELPDEDMIKIGSGLCKANTKYKNLKNIKVDYCRCDNIEKGDKIGIVVYKSNKKIKQCLS